MATSENPYRLDMRMMDNQDINLESTQWLLFTNAGTVDDNHSQQFNTLYVQVCSNN